MPLDFNLLMSQLASFSMQPKPFFPTKASPPQNNSQRTSSTEDESPEEKDDPTDFKRFAPRRQPVQLPRGVKELGIKNRNYSETQQLQFKIDPYLILRDGRTSLMIKNIPNKYSQDMLKELLDRTHALRYDFLYLPLDFKNHCNVGYAFVNVKRTQDVVSLYAQFNGKKWQYFKSEKICEITYARIQGFNKMRKHF